MIVFWLLLAETLTAILDAEKLIRLIILTKRRNDLKNRLKS